MKTKFFLTAFFLCYVTIIFAQKKNIEILEHPNKISIEEIKILNSKCRETNLSISPDGKYLYFMTDRGEMPWSVSYGIGLNGQPRYDGDIWYSSKINGEWQKPEPIDNVVNTSDGEDEPNISPDGQFVVYQSWTTGWETKNGPYYISVLENNKWTKPKGLGGGINKYFYNEFYKNMGYATDGMSVSPDRKTFIVACGKIYNGNLDLYISKFADNQWTYLKNLDINTKLDERSIFIAGDGKTIFFASNGYGGFGKLDIFKALLTDSGTVTDIKNIGEPFNTKEDDYGFIVTASGKEAYFVRNGDIFYAHLGDDNKLSPTPTVIINGLIKDCNNKFIETYLDLTYLDDNTKIATSKSSSKGEFSFSFAEKSGNFKISNNELSKIKFDTTFVLKSLGTYQEVNVILDICKNNPIITTTDTTKNKPTKLTLNINFDFDKDIVKSLYFKEIETFLTQIDKTKNYKIELIGHTDSKGNDTYNEDLGLRRANNVMNYMIKLGYQKDKINIVTKGEKILIADESTKDGAFKNRRVEVILYLY